jgi:hypothetical protein
LHNISNEPNEVQAAAAALGFPPLEPVSSLFSIAQLFGATKRRCGIYLLVFETGVVYIGQAVDVVRRFAQHRRNHDDIIGFSFKPARQTELDDLEVALIFRAESLGLILSNAVHVTNIIGDTDFDLVVPVDEQDHWLNARPILPTRDLTSPKIILPEPQQIRYSKQFSRFNAHPLSSRALALLKVYLSQSVPMPRRTEYSFWSVSCMPATNGAWPRLICVSAAVMELFVVGWERQDPKLLWSFVNVAEDVLLEHWRSEDELIAAFPFIQILKRGYRDAGRHQIGLGVSNGASMELLLADAGIAKAASALTLRVMRKRATIYGKYHCVQLANLALSSNDN